MNNGELAEVSREIETNCWRKNDEEVLHRILKQEPANWSAHLQLAETYIGVGRLDLAHRHLDCGAELSVLKAEPAAERIEIVRRCLVDAEQVRREAEQARREAELNAAPPEQSAASLEAEFDNIREVLKSHRYRDFHASMMGMVNAGIENTLFLNNSDGSANKINQGQVLDAVNGSMERYLKFARETEIFFEWSSHMLHSLEAVSVDGSYCEFGVCGGGTVNFIAHTVSPKTIHGFDSFLGLPEEWEGEAPGFLSRGGEVPALEDNVEIHIGWFEDTIPNFAKYNDQPLAFAHIDCDLYSSTMSVLENLSDRLRPGTVLVFDEYPIEEFQAWADFCAAQELDFKYLSSSLGTISSSLIIR